MACLDSGCPSDGLPTADLTPTHSPRPEQPAGQRSIGFPMHSPSSTVELVHAGRTQAHVSESFRKQCLRLGICRCTRTSHRAPHTCGPQSQRVSGSTAPSSDAAQVPRQLPQDVLFSRQCQEVPVSVGVALVGGSGLS